jgi:Tol biopolymer transport system component
MKTKILASLLPVLFLFSACHPTVAALKPTTTPLPPTATSTLSPTQTLTLTFTPTVFPTLSGSGGGVIAYTLGDPASGRMQLNIVNLDGSEDRKLISLGFGVNHSDWSPDGQKIAAVRYMDASFSTWSIYVFDADGSNPVRLTTTTGAEDSEPAWSPDGAQILFSRIEFTSNTELRSDLWLMNADGGDQHIVVADGFAGKWSPDGKRIIYASNKTGNYEIYTSNTDGTNEKRLTDTSADEAYPVWSPDGKQIVFSASTGVWNTPESVRTFEIYVMNADGSGRRQLTDNTAADGNPRWSPDGSLLTFTSDRAASEHYDVYVMEADGTNVRQVTHTPSGARAINPIWQPTH